MPGAPGRSYQKIYAVVRRIPRGRVATYGQVASVAGMHGAARLVGYALHASQEHHGVPWQRVVAAGGRLTLGKLDAAAALTQRIRLEHEGVRFTARGTVDMAAHQWATGRDAVGRRAAKRPPRRP